MVWFLGMLPACAVQPEVLIKWRRPAGTPLPRPGPTAFRAALLRLGAEYRRPVGPAGWDVAALPEGADLRAWLDHARFDPAVAHVEPNRRYHALATVNDRLFPRLHGLAQIGAPTAWNTTTGSSNVVIAVLDTGINFEHPDLIPVLWTNPGEIAGNGLDDDGNGVVDDVHGADFVENDGDPADDAGHGSHVAGIIAGAGNNQIGVAGVAYGCRLMPVRILSADGGAFTSDIVRAFDYVRAFKAQGVNVRLINNSWGGDYPSLAIFEAISACADAGILSVCAAGNDALDADIHPSYPAAYNTPGVLSVAASDSCDLAAGFSNYGRRTVHLAAPGSGIYSCWGHGHSYNDIAGTSMAAPHVTGAAALLLSRQPSLTLAQLRALMLYQSDAQPAWTNRTATGARLNVAKAMTFLNAGTAVPTNDPPNAALTNSAWSLVSRVRNGGPARDVSFSGSFGSSVTENGRFVVFHSYDTNLVPGDTGGFVQVYLRDTVANTNGRVSQTLAGITANADCQDAVISRNGNYVAFASAANNLTVGDNDDARDVFVWERATRTLRLVSFDPQNAAFILDADSPAISDDGAFVAFAGETAFSGGNYIRDIYVWRRAQNTTQIINFKAPATYANDWSDGPSISGDGRYVAYHTWADNLVAGDTNNAADIQVFDRNSSVTTRVSRNPANQQANADSYYPILSGDGAYVAFHSTASNLGQLPANGLAQIYLHNRANAQLTQVTLDAAGQPLAGTNFLYDVNHDGRFVLFTTDSRQLPPFHGLQVKRPYLYDRLTGFQNLVGLNDGGLPGDDSSYYPAVSATGEYVVFSSWANNLVAPDGNDLLDVFRWRRGTQVADLRVRPAGQTNWLGAGMVHARASQRVSASNETNGIARAEAQVFNSGLAATSFVLRALVTSGWQLTAQTTNNADVTSAVLAGTQSSGSLAAGASYFLRLALTRTNANAELLGTVRLVVRVTGGTNDLDAVEAVASHPLSPAGLRLVSRNATGEPALLGAYGATFESNGQRLAFSSAAENLVSADDNRSDDVFVASPDTASLVLASAASDGTPGNAGSARPFFARTGGLVAFQSEANNLVPGDANDAADIFIRNLQTGETELASLSVAGTALTRGSESPLLSEDGRYVVFQSIGSDVVSGDTNVCLDVFLRDRETGKVECVSRGPLGQSGNGDSTALAMTPDARYVLFQTHASNFAVTDTNQFPDIFLRDRLLNRLELISGRSDFETADGHAFGGSLSDDGRFVTFRVDATAPLAWETNHLFLLDRSTGLRSAIVPQAYGLAADLELYSAEISPNGALLALVAGGSCGSTNGMTQLWLAPRTGGAARMISATRNGTRGTADSFGVVFSGGNQRYAFSSAATNLAGELRPAMDQLFMDDTAVLFPDAALARTAEGNWRGAGEITTNQTTLEQPLAFNVPRDFYLRVTDFSGVGGGVVVTAPTGTVAVCSLRYFSENNAGQEVTASLPGGWIFNPGTNALDLRMRLRVTLLTTNAPAAFTINVRSLNFPALQENILLRLVQDADNDGLADTWERNAFGNLTGANGTTDFDGDGVSDLQEYLAGTNPKNAASRLRLDWQTLGTGATFRVADTQTNRFYSLEATPALGSAFAARTAEQRGNGTTLLLQDPEPPATNGFYRVRATLP